MYASLFIIMGVQSILFSIFTRIFGVNTGLLPQEDNPGNPARPLGLEKGLIISLGMIALGFISSIGALIYWGENRFGPIDPSLSMRLVIPGAVMFTLGIQIFFASFFISILNTRIKSRPS
jgi:hypothetical protein